MLRRITFTKDNWISNKYLQRGYATGSNHGMDEVLELYKKSELLGDYSFTYAKILAQIDVTKITDLGIAAGTSVGYRLKIFDVTHGDELPYSYDIDMHPLVSQSWDEGRGIDEESHDDGYSNWLSASSVSTWNTSGAFHEYSSSLSSSYHFDYGWEDIDTDFTEPISYWLSGNTNYGFIAKLPTTYEDNDNEYWRKSFYSRHAKNVAKRPYVQVAYDDSYFDDRDNMYYDETGNLYMYRVINGALKDFDTDVVDNVYVKIQDTVYPGSATYEAHFTSSYSTTGTYYTSFNVSSTGSHSGSVWHDIWYSGSTVFYSGTFTLSSPQTSSGSVVNNMIASVANLRAVYNENDKAKIRVTLEDNSNYRDRVLSASYMSNQIFSQQLYWGVKEDYTNEVIVPFNTGTFKGTRLAYDAQGHNTTIYMDNFVKGHLYRLVLYLEHNGEQRVLDKGWRFKVV